MFVRGPFCGRRHSCTVGGSSVGAPTQANFDMGQVMDEAIRSAAISPGHLAVLNGSEWFASLDSALRQTLVMASRVVSLPAGASVFLRDDPSDGVYCVI